MDAGFAVVVQDVRGRFGSPGAFAAIRHEGPDTYDTVEWVAAQPWCTASVGMTGRSYCGEVQWLGAVLRPPHLRAVVPMLTPVDPTGGWLYQGGAFQLGFNLFWLRLLLDPDASGRIEPLARQLPLGRLEPFASDPLARFYFDWLEHDPGDPWWDRLRLGPRLDGLPVAALHVGGWYDLYLAGTLESFRRVGGRLVVGPWGHGSAYGAFPDHRFREFGDGADADLTEVQLRFFARQLRGERNGLDDEPPVRLFVMGADRWRSEDRWPLARAVAERWYLRAGARLERDRPPGGDEPPDRYVFDPADPAPTVGGPAALPGPMMKTNTGPRDQRSIEQRSDVLVFTSDPLPEALEVTGPLRVEVWVASSAVDCDVVVKLTDVQPDGTSLILAEGITRARYRDGYDRPRWLTPGEPVKIPVDLVATSNLFRPGHRVRVDVTSSSFPRFDRNLGTDAAVGTEGPDAVRPATQTVFHDARHPSHIVLPVVRG